MLRIERIFDKDVLGKNFVMFVVKEHKNHNKISYRIHSGMNLFFFKYKIYLISEPQQYINKSRSLKLKMCHERGAFRKPAVDKIALMRIKFLNLLQN